MLGTSDSSAGSGGSGQGSDVDRLLAGYRTAGAQQALFDLRDGPRVGYDEFVDEAGNVRPAWTELAAAVGERGRAGLDRLRSVVHRLIDNDGITYTGVDAGCGSADADGTWRRNQVPGSLDPLPLLLSGADWEVLEAGLVQRSRLLDAVLADLYGSRRSLTSGVLPPELLFAHPGYLRVANGIEVPGHHQLFMHACDVSRLPDGSFQINADWTQAPSGAGYALADRRVVAHAIPDLYEKIAPRPTTPFAQTLRLALIDAAPDGAQDPAVVVLSPGIYSETAFDQAYLATLLGFPLVASADLVVRDGTVWMRSLGTLKRVDVVLRRVDADYTDPLDLRADSRLGVVGLVEVLRRGAVTVVNTLGSGILESPGLLRFLPELAQQLLGEDPLLDTALVYWAGIDSERSHLLANLSSLLIKSTVGGEIVVGPTLSATERRRSRRANHGHARPVDRAGAAAVLVCAHRLCRRIVLGRYRHAAVLGCPTRRVCADDRRTGVRIGTRCSRIHTGILCCGEDVCSAAGRKRGARRDGEFAVGRPAGEDQRRGHPGAQLAACPCPSLFWMGRYGERAENMARLLIVARERYHEFRHQQNAEESECVPVLMAALGHVTGTDAGADDDHAEMIAVAPSTLWSLTVDRGRPGSLVQSVDGLALAARAVRDQLSRDTWMVLTGVERAMMYNSDPPDSLVEADALLASVHAQTLAGMLTLSGVAGESMVRDVGWTMMDIGKRIERGLWLTALLRNTLSTVRGVTAEQLIIESTLLASCESSVIYRRRTVGTVSVARAGRVDAVRPDQPAVTWCISWSGFAPTSATCRARRGRRGRSGRLPRSAPGCAGPIPRSWRRSSTDAGRN